MIEKIFDATDENLHPVLSLIEEELEKRDCSMKTQMMIAVMAEEIFINIAHYAYTDKTGQVKICLDFKGDDFYLTFIDSGIEFDPLKKPDPDITASAQEREIGGLCIYMVKKTMDEVTYAREDGKNILTLRKAIR